MAAIPRHDPCHLSPTELSAHPLLHVSGILVFYGRHSAAPRARRLALTQTFLLLCKLPRKGRWEGEITRVVRFLPGLSVFFFFFCYKCLNIVVFNYQYCYLRNIPIISPVLTFVQKAFLVGLFLERLIIVILRYLIILIFSAQIGTLGFASQQGISLPL